MEKREKRKETWVEPQQCISGKASKCQNWHFIVCTYLH